MKNLPVHIGIIMDGNGRWAQLQGRERTYGHLQGARIARDIIEACAQRGIQFLTMYAFSTENWLRPKSEVLFLMQLLYRKLKDDRERLIQNNIRFSCIGQINNLPASVRREVEKTIQATAHCTGMRLIFALSYGGRQDITQAAQRLAQDVLDGAIKVDQIDEDKLNSYLSTAEIPDPDLIIRTSGEYRLSNFLTWQSAYSEFFFTETLWPDFSSSELEHILSSYTKRERRFGRVTDLPNPSLEKDCRLKADPELNSNVEHQEQRESLRT